MQAVPDNLFKALADPTRRAIFEHLARGGEQTVHALTDHAGVSQPAVSKHLGVLKLASPVRDRREGRETRDSAQPQALVPLIDWMSLYGAFDKRGVVKAQNSPPLPCFSHRVIARVVEDRRRVARSWVLHTRVWRVGNFDPSFISFSPDYPPSRSTLAYIKPVRRPTSLTPAGPQLPRHSSFAVPQPHFETRPAIRKNPSHLK